MGARGETNATIPKQTETKQKQNNSVTRVGGVGGSRMTYATLKQSRNSPETVQKQSRSTPETSQKHPGNTLETPWKHPGNTLEAPRKHPTNIPETLQKHPRNIPETSQKHSRHIPETFQKHSRNIPGPIELGAGRVVWSWFLSPSRAIFSQRDTPASEQHAYVQVMAQTLASALQATVRPNP